MKEREIRRSVNLIQDDMLQWIQQNIFARIGQEWDYRGQDFDPLIHLLVGAFASEIKGVYEAINDSDRRVLKQLAQMLLPESKHLPSPAHTLIKVIPSTTVTFISEQLQLYCDVAGEKVFFSPVFDQTLTKLNLKFVVSDLGGFNYKEAALFENSGYKTDIVSGTLSHLFLGFEIPEMIKTVRNTSFYVNLKGNSNNKTIFADAVTRGVWQNDDVVLLKEQGFATVETIENLLDSSIALRARIEGIYKKAFATITEDKSFIASKGTSSEIIEKWARQRSLLSNESIRKIVQQGGLEISNGLVWIAIDLAYPVTVNDFFNNFSCSTQVFPAVNRKLETKDDGDTYFDSPALNIIQIQTDHPILGVNRVVEKQLGKSFTYKPLAYLKGDLEPSFSIRYGGIGRLDNYNVWQRCLYLLSVFREEHNLKEIAEKIAPNISLEELHILLGEKISKDDFYTSQNPQHLAYIFMHPGLTARGLSAFVEYWTTLGDFANDIPAKYSLYSEVAISGLQREEKTLIYGQLITPSTGGKKLANDTELFHALKDAIIRKERLVTPYDVISFCRSRVQADVKKINIKQGVDLDTRPGFGITRTTEVLLEVLDADNMRWEGVCKELENSLNENTLASIPFRVKLKLAEG